uniref:Uncharacterized protein n=1 Tax=Anguilla anguilla TaxID=7936 RepID=A0A0E9PYN0_ANGAN
MESVYHLIIVHSGAYRILHQLQKI